MKRQVHRSGTGAGDDPAEGAPADQTGAGDLLTRALDALRGQLDQLAARPEDADELADAIRESYSELLDDYGDDSEALARIRALGRRIADLEETGVLPRSLIRRGRSRR